MDWQLDVGPHQVGLGRNGVCAKRGQPPPSVATAHGAFDRPASARITHWVQGTFNPGLDQLLDKALP